MFQRIYYVRQCKYQYCFGYQRRCAYSPVIGDRALLSCGAAYSCFKSTSMLQTGNTITREITCYGSFSCAFVNNI